MDKNAQKNVFKKQQTQTIVPDVAEEERMLPYNNA